MPATVQKIRPSVNVMEELLKSSPKLIIPKPGTLVEGTVIGIAKNRVLMDLGGVCTGIISGREARDSHDTIKHLKVGDHILTYVIDEENEDGLAVLSLRKASQEKTWKNFIEAHEKGHVISVTAAEANKGGLLLDIDGIKGFIPVSQLAPMHYPRVNGADANLILSRLQQLVGKKFSVKIISVDKENGKLILSEKAAHEAERSVSLEKLKIGNTVKGRVSGIVKFGIFVAFEGLEGLVHISEIAWGHVKNPADFAKLGQDVTVQVIGIEGDKISLSMKRLTTDPWIEIASKYTIGTIVEGEVSRLTPFGAFMELGDDINGLIHLTEITDQEIKDPSEVLKAGQHVKAKVIALEPEEHRIGLSIKALSEKEPLKEEKEEEKMAV